MNLQAGEDFPQLPIRGIPIPDLIKLDTILGTRGLSPIPVMDQGPIGLCTATAGAMAATYAFARQLPQGNPPPWRMFSPEPTFAWSKTAVPGGNPTPSGGSTVANVARALRDFGAVPAARLPMVDLSRVNGSRAMGWGGGRFPVDQELRKVAAMRRFDLYRVNADIRQIREALALGAGVFVSVPFTFIATDSRGMAALIPGVHAMPIVGRIERGPTGKPCLEYRQSYGSRIFAQSLGRPHPLFGVVGGGLIEEARTFEALADRRVGFAVFPRGAKV